MTKNVNFLSLLIVEKRSLLKKMALLSCSVGASFFAQAQTSPVSYPKKVPTNAEIDATLQGKNIHISNSNLVFGYDAYVSNEGELVGQITPFTDGLQAGFEMDKGVVFSTNKVSKILEKRVVDENYDYRDADYETFLPRKIYIEALGRYIENGEYEAVYIDEDLVGLEEKAAYTPVVYEFDITLADTVSGLNIAYQFGSNEYVDFVGSVYNDAFGFFISGPGLDGKVNMAKLPDGNITSVNTVNQRVLGSSSKEENVLKRQQVQNANTDYYINNGTFDITDEAYITTTSEGYLQYTGTEETIAERISIHTMLTGMTKLINYNIRGLQPGGTYKFKIAIANSVDAGLGSAVFVKEISAFADLNANEDTYVLRAGETTTSVLDNDTSNGNVVLADHILITADENIPTGFVIDSEGKIVVDKSVQPGTYEFSYTICDKENTDFCSTAKVKIIIEGMCFKPGNFIGDGEPSLFGISTIGMPNDNWPKNIPNAHLVMESNEKGFAINQVNSVADIAEPVEGMLVYDNTDQCVKLYNGESWNCLQKACFND